MPPDPPEEIFVVFIFMECARSSDHTPTLIRMYTTLRYAMNVAWLKFSWFLFFALTCQSENRENLHAIKISRYTVLCIIMLHSWNKVDSQLIPWVSNVNVMFKV